MIKVEFLFIKKILKIIINEMIMREYIVTISILIWQIGEVLLTIYIKSIIKQQKNIILVTTIKVMIDGRYSMVGKIIKQKWKLYVII